MIARLFIALAMLMSGDIAWQGFEPLYVTQLGCHITQSSLGWQTDVYAEQREHPRFEMVLAVEPKRIEAFKDCDAWMQEAKRRVDEAARKQRQQ